MSAVQSAFDLGVVISAIDHWTGPMKKIENSMKYSQKGIDQITKSMKNMGMASGDVDKVTKSLDKMQQNKAWANLAKDLKAAGVQQPVIDKMAQGFENLANQQKKIDQLTTSIGKLKKVALTGVGITAAGGVLGLGLEKIGESIMKPAMDFQEVMNNVKIASFGKDLLDATKADEIKSVVADLTAGFEKLGVATKFSDTSAAQAALGMMRGGLDRNFILGAKGADGQYNYSGLTAAMYSAQLGEVEPQAAGDFIAKQRAAFNMTPDKTLDAVNFYTKTSAASTMDFKDLMSGMLTASGVAGQIHMTPQDTAMLVAATGTYTKDGGAAGTFTKDFLDRLMPHSKGQKKAMEDMGWMKGGKSIFFDDTGNVKSADFITKTMQDTSKKYKPNEFQAMMSKVFLEQGKNTALALATDSNVYGDIKGNVSNQLDMYQQVDFQMKGTKNVLESLKETFNIVKRLFGEPFLEPFARALQALNNFLGNNVAQWAKAHPGVIKFIGAAAAAVAVLLTLSGMFITVAGAVGMLRFALPLLATKGLPAIKSLLPTILRLSGAFGLVLIAAYALYKHWVDWKDIKPFIEGIAIAWGTYKTAVIATNIVMKAAKIATTTWTAAQWALNAAMRANPIGLVITGIGLLVGAIIWCVQNWDKVKAAMAHVWQMFKDHPILWFVTGPIGVLIGALAGIITNWDQVVASFKSGWLQVQQFFVDGVNFIRRQANEAIDIANHLPGVNLEHYAYLTVDTSTPAVQAAVPYDSSVHNFGGTSYAPQQPNKSFRDTFLSGSNKSGLWNVPYDGYISELHEGERVLPAGKAEQSRTAETNPFGMSGRGNTVIINPHPQQNSYEIAQQVAQVLGRQSAMQSRNIGVTVNRTAF